MIPKVKKYKKKKNDNKNKNHLIYVSSLSCCLNDMQVETKNWCKGNIQAHHLLKPFEGTRGAGMKASDKNVVPLCYKHHAMLHDIIGNEDKFWTLFNLDENYGRLKAKSLWETSPFKRKE